MTHLCGVSLLIGDAVYFWWRWDSSVIIVTRLRAGRKGNSSSIPDRGKIFFSFGHHSDRFWGPPGPNPVDASGKVIGVKNTWNCAC
jgi:hypothetical protein